MTSATASSMGAASGDSLLVIGALLGHRTAKTTECYTHLDDHPVKAAADRIADEIARHLDQALATDFDPVDTADDGNPFDAVGSGLAQPLPQPSTLYWAP